MVGQVFLVTSSAHKAPEARGKKGNKQGITQCIVITETIIRLRGSGVKGRSDGAKTVVWCLAEAKLYHYRNTRQRVAARKVKVDVCLAKQSEEAKALSRGGRGVVGLPTVNGQLRG